MKKLLTIVLVLWIVIAISFVLVWQNMNFKDSSQAYNVAINRIQFGLSNLIEESSESQINMYIDEQVTLNEQIIALKMMSTEAENFGDFIKGVDIPTDQFVFRNIPESSYVVRYVIDEEMSNCKKVYIYSGFIIILLTILLFGVFIWIYLSVIKPSRRISKLPSQLAKGNLSYKVPQDKSGYFREFLWGIDRLREVLQEEKDKNIALEKQRKTLVASLSHDIRTPLASIQNYGKAIKDGIYVTKEQQEKAIDIILDKSFVIEKLTKELLDNSKKLMDNMTINIKDYYSDDLFVDIERLIHQKIDLLKMEYESKLPGRKRLVSVDVDRIIEVVDNILENAIKYGDGRLLKLEVSDEEGFLIMTFTNSGKSINKEELKYIFTSFYRGSNRDGLPGHGLGLYIAKQLMKAMNGDIYADNTPQGFSVSLVIKIV